MIDHHVNGAADAARRNNVHASSLGRRAESLGAGRRTPVRGQRTRSLHATGDAPILPRVVRPFAAVEAQPEREGFGIEPGPVPRIGAAGPVRPLCLRDPDGRLLEVSEHA